MNNNNFKIAVIFLTFSFILFACGSSKSSSMSHVVAKVEMKDTIEGVCDIANVYAMLPFPGNGQIEASTSKTAEEITLELNNKVSFLKDKSDYNDEGIVSIIVNCKGEPVKCAIDNKTKSADLDSQIIAVFAELKTWTAGTIHGKPVDSMVLYSIKIKNGKITVS